jgi:hypothetical protein
LAVKSDSGSASTNTASWMSRKLSVVATSTCMREGLSQRAQTTPESVDTSPDATPCVMAGRSGARLSDGRAMPPKAVIAAEAATVFISRRRVSAAPGRALTAIGPPPSNHGGRCLRFLTKTRSWRDDDVTIARQRPPKFPVIYAAALRRRPLPPGWARVRAQAWE